ncbi:MAG: hypothetical protein ACE3L7_23240 [Candidatus Pristimantibacillus sp.]
MAINRVRVEKRVCTKIISKKTVCKKTVSKKRVCKPIKRRSAFRAVSGVDQQLLDGSISQVQYQVEELDLNNEYNSATSTFRPKQNGVYTLFASVFFRTTTVTSYTLNLEIRVNGVPRISDQEDYNNISGIIDTGGIVNLNASDRVQVFARVIDKNVEIQSGLATRFEGARIS